MENTASKPFTTVRVNDIVTVGVVLSEDDLHLTLRRYSGQQDVIPKAAIRSRAAVSANAAERMGWRHAFEYAAQA